MSWSTQILPQAWFFKKLPVFSLTMWTYRKSWRHAVPLSGLEPDRIPKVQFCGLRLPCGRCLWCVYTFVVDRKQRRIAAACPGRKTTASNYVSFFLSLAIDRHVLETLFSYVLTIEISRSASARTSRVCGSYCEISELCFWSPCSM